MGFGGWSVSLGASQGRARLGGAGVGAMGTGLGASRGALAASSDMGGGAMAGSHGTWVRAFDGIRLVHLCRDGPLPGTLPGRPARGRSFSRWVAMAACQWVELGFGAVGLGLHRAVSCAFASAGRVHRPARVCPERACLRTRHGLGAAVDGSAASPGLLRARLNQNQSCRRNPPHGLHDPDPWRGSDAACSGLVAGSLLPEYFPREWTTQAPRHSSRAGPVANTTDPTESCWTRRLLRAVSAGASPMPSRATPPRRKPPRARGLSARADYP